MAKKTKKVVEMTAFENAVMKIESAPVDVRVSIDNEEYVVSVKQHIPGDVRSAIIEQVESMFYAGGVYDPNRGTSVLEFILFQMYTDVTFGDDLDCFERFKISEHYEIIGDAFSSEYHEVYMDALQKAKALKAVYFAPIEQTAMYSSLKNTADMLRALLDSIDSLVKKTTNDIEKGGGIDIKEMIDALQLMKGKDEKKIAKAVLDYQEAKAKKMAVPETPIAAKKPVLHL